MDFRISELTKAIPVGDKAIQDKEVNKEFEFTLKRLGNDNLSERLSALINEITAQGDKIAKHMDVRDIRAYRALITEFINEVVTNSYEFSRENFLNRRGRHRVYSIVRLINKDVDDLAQEVLAKEKDHILILDKIGEINGLLLDLTI